MALLDTNIFDLLSASRAYKSAFEKPEAEPAGEQSEATKEAFTPSPAIEQAIMAQAQGGGQPPGGGGGGQPQPQDLAQQGVPPGMDPNAMNAAMQGQPPPGTPAPRASGASGATGGGDPSAGGSSDPALAAKVDQLIQMMQQNSQGGQGGSNGKPNTASLKFEPQQFHQMAHDISNLKAIMVQMADAMGLQIPASALVKQPPPGTPLPGMEQQAQGQPAAQGTDPAQQPSQIAQQLPSLPAVAGKSASAADVNRLAAGVRVSQDSGTTPLSHGALIARFAAARMNGNGKAHQ